MPESKDIARRGRTGPRLIPLALLASGAAAMMLTVVWNDAASRQQAGPSDAVRLATAALHKLGYDWARVTLRGSTLHLAGRAPDDSSRVLAYHITRQALRPLMGKDAQVSAIRSTLSLRAPASVQSGNRIAAGPAIDLASLVPPPLPLSHAAPIETAALSTTSALAEEPSGNPGIPNPADPGTTASIETSSTQQSPPPAEPERAPEPAAAPTPPQPQHAVRTITIETEPIATPVRTAALDTPAPSAPAQTQSACAQSFSQALSSGMIQFARDSAAIDKESRPLLDKIAAIAKRCKGYRFTVEGHTDLTGSRTHNMELSRKRAEAVRWALVDRGIDMDHVSAAGYGSTRPIENSTTDAANAKNRRIAITVASGK